MSTSCVYMTETTRPDTQAQEWHLVRGGEVSAVTCSPGSEPLTGPSWTRPSGPPPVANFNLCPVMVINHNWSLTALFNSSGP